MTDTPETASREAALRLKVLSEIAAASDFSELAEPLSIALQRLRLSACRMTLLEPGPDAFTVRAAVVSSAKGFDFDDTNPDAFPRGDPMTEAIFAKGESTLWRPYADGRRALSDRALELWSSGMSDGLSVVSRTSEGWRVCLCVTAPVEDTSDAFEARFDELKGPLKLITEAARRPASRIIARLPRPTLSPSEVATLSRLAQGLRPVEIAKDRGVAEATVRNQVVALRRKLSARSNAHAVALGLRLGLLPEKHMLSGVQST